ncbi:MAG: hypothetical protein GY855_16555 [candidate division Zixibacteria bacterium]|nr:hypothetical protein [candidate division Zixibacteria bacterium]
MMIIRNPFIKALLMNFVAWILFVLILIVFYFVWLREYQMNWGATTEEVNRYMAGDELLENPEFNATRAVEINATPDKIWPWIVQMGYSKGGFYGFDKLDNGGNPSATEIIPEYQNLNVGDSIASGEYQGKLFNFIEVVSMEPEKSMLWVFIDTPWKDATWSWGLYKMDNGRTKLVSRLRKGYTFNSFQGIIAWSLADTIEILMMRTTLLGIKLRVERI